MNLALPYLLDANTIMWIKLLCTTLRAAVMHTAASVHKYNTFSPDLRTHQHCNLKKILTWCTFISNALFITDRDLFVKLCEHTMVVILVFSYELAPRGYTLFSRLSYNNTNLT